MLTEEHGYTMHVAEDGQVRVTRVTHILEDGVKVAQKLPHQQVLHPGHSLGGQDPYVQRVVKAAHTPQKIAEWDAAQAQRRAEQ